MGLTAPLTCRPSHEAAGREQARDAAKPGGWLVGTLRTTASGTKERPCGNRTSVKRESNERILSCLISYDLSSHGPITRSAPPSSLRRRSSSPAARRCIARRVRCWCSKRSSAANWSTAPWRRMTVPSDTPQQDDGEDLDQMYG